jgi:Ca2+-transporting ATPase
MFLILGLSLFTFIIGLLRNQPWIDMLVAAITLAVAMIPEGLPAALTVTLSLGVSRMARRRVIIRKLPAVETLGSATVICSDKTGTLTQNQMTVQQIVTPNECYEVSGSGYNPKGEIIGVLKTDDALVETLKAGVLCNDSELIPDSWQPQGDPTEVALITSGYKTGMPPDKLNDAYPRLDHIPFESQHQYMVTLHKDGENNNRIAYLKGAVEVILTKCTHSIDSQGQKIELDAEQVHENVKEMALRGLRVLAFARKELPGNVDHITHNLIESHLTFVGLQGMIDLPRPEAIAAVRACQSAGIKVKMITGDHSLTAGAIAFQIGLDDASQSGSPRVLTGSNLAALKDEELIQEAENVSVSRTKTASGRSSPEKRSDCRDDRRWGK